MVLNIFLLLLIRNAIAYLEIKLIGVLMRKVFMTATFLTVLTNYSNGFAAEYIGSSANNVWDIVTSNPYKRMPTTEVTYKDLFDGLTSLIQRSANRTLNDHRDILPPFKKLAHPNGACLKGQWIITKENPYSGLFKFNTKSIIIARASVALSKTENGDLRGFGLAGKLFPTTNENKVVKTANFFLIDDLGGTSAEHYTDVEMTNEPKVTPTIAVLENIRYAAKLATTFAAIDSHPTKRQVYEIAETNLKSNESLNVPKWMMVKASSNQKKIDAQDFRDEFEMEANNGSMSFDIHTADTEDNQGKNWKKIGKIVFNESIISGACDHQLHFHHPIWRDDVEKN